MSYLCRNGHLVKHNHQAGLDCAKCKANERRRICSFCRQPKRSHCLTANAASACRKSS